MRNRRKGALVVAVAGLGGLIATLLPASAAYAHGAYTFPASRSYACYQDAHQENGALDPSNPACQEVLDREGNYPFYNWFSNLISDVGDKQAGEEHFHSSIPDGQLCGPTEEFSAFNMARTDWPTTDMQSGSVTFRWQAWAAHPGWFYQYVTKPGWDPNQKLSWDDLVLFNVADHPPLDGSAPNGEYTWTADVPERDGRHVIYTIWERSDSPEVFFSCSDVTFSGGGGDQDTQAPTAPGDVSASNVTADSAQLSWGASSDNIGVVRYEVRRANGSQVASASGTSVTVDGLSPETTYTMNVVALDAAGNTSPSSSITFTTGSDGGTEPPPEQECQVAYDVVNQWGGGFTGEVTITNGGETAIDGWTVEWNFPGGQSVTNGWSGQYSQQGSTVTVQNASWNGTVQPRGSVTTGFNASYSGSNPDPTTFSCTTG